MARGQILTVTDKTTFHVEECCACGVQFAITEAFYEIQQRKKEAGRFFCPNGHEQCYVGKSDAQLAKEARAAREHAEAALQAERDQRLAAERELARHEKRAKGGVCPCCNRSFVQLARHMKGQHPDYANG